jgi:hypothetical protein
MSEIAEIVDTLEDKIHKLFIKLEGLEKNSQESSTNHQSAI